MAFPVNSPFVFADLIQIIFRYIYISLVIDLTQYIAHLILLWNYFIIFSNNTHYLG